MAEFDEKIVRNNIEAVCIQSDGSLDVEYKVEPMQIMGYLGCLNPFCSDIIFI
ncbi:MAG: hypothetical protein RR469_03360 [Erysipelotrichaceae bacterium]